MLTCKELASCHPTPFACHSERREESRSECFRRSARFLVACGLGMTERSSFHTDSFAAVAGFACVVTAGSFSILTFAIRRPSISVTV